MFWWRVACIAYAAFSTFLLLVPHPLQALGLAKYSESLAAGRGQHLAIFAGLTLFVLLARWPLRRTALLGMVVGYAALTEAVQGFIPPRQADWRDLAENLAGLVLGFALYSAANFWIRRDGSRP